MKKKSSKSEGPYNHWEDYICTKSFRQIPMSEAGLLHLAQTLNEWATKRDSYVLNDFIDHYGLSPKTFYAWIARSPVLKSAHEYAMRRLASNREVGALTKKLEVGPFKHVQHRYDDAWREADEYHSRLKSQENKEVSSGFIVVRDMPTSDLVPVRGLAKDTGEDEQ